MTNFLYSNDLPDGLEIKGDLAIDTETRGLNIYQRDRLCVVQISNGDGDAHLVHFKDGQYNKAHNLKKLLSDQSTQKIFHFARFDIAVLKIYLGVDTENIFCTKIASKLTRTYTDKHGLKYLCREILGVDLSKQQQCSDWAGELNTKQIEYAASDVLHLHALRKHFIEQLADVGREDLAKRCFAFLPTRAGLDISGWPEEDIFAH